MLHFFKIDGEPHRAGIIRRGRQWVLLHAGAEAPFTLQPLDAGRYLLNWCGASEEVFLALRGDVAFVHARGVTYEVVFEDATAVLAQEGDAAGEDVSRAPMPGAVVSVHVTAGATVAAGDVLIVIESMKLETTIRAHRAGVIETVHVEQGQTFERDAALVTLAAIGGP